MAKFYTTTYISFKSQLARYIVASSKNTLTPPMPAGILIGENIPLP